MTGLKQYPNCNVQEKKITTKYGRTWAYLLWKPLNHPPKDRIVMHHGLIFDKHLWDDLAAYFCGERGMEVYAFDLPGHGDSSKVAIPYEKIHEDVLNITDTLQLSPFHYMGCSIGSEWGMRTSISNPDYVKSLIVIGPTVLEATVDEKTNFKLMNDEWRKAGMRSAADFMFSEPHNFSNRFLSEARFAKLRDREYNRICHLDPVVFDIAEIWINRTITYDYSQIQCPILIMCGADDELFLHQAEHLFSMVPKGYLELIPDAAHQGPMENPEKCIELIETFFEHI